LNSIDVLLATYSCEPSPILVSLITKYFYIYIQIFSPRFCARLSKRVGDYGGIFLINLNYAVVTHSSKRI